MGSLGDHDDEIQPVMRNSTLDRSDTETQSFGCQSSPPSLPDKKFKDKDFDELQFLQSTLPFVDTVPLEDAFETQFMNLAGETQVWDDPDGIENMGTQLLDECDNEVNTDGGGTDGTEVLGDTEELSDDDSVKRVGSNPGDQENKLYTTISEQDDRGFKAEFDGLINEQRNSELYVSAARLPDKGTPEPKPGSVRRDFTSVRAAALRTSGLAARSMAFKGTNSEPYSIKSDGRPSKQHTAEDNGITVFRDSSAFGEEVDQDDFLGKYTEQMKGLRNENKCRVGSSTMRRLFMDDTLAEIEGPNNYTNNADGGADLPQLPACGHEMVGLSYVDSQEPGELSQTAALDFVDRFLRFNVMDFDQEVIGRPSTGGKSKPVSNAKGTQSLAKITNLKSTAEERGIFDWDDSREDEGGGEFFTKKKEAFFDIGGQRHRCVTQPQKLRHLDFKGRQAVDETRDKEQRLDIHRKVKGLVNSNLELVLRNTKRNDKIVKVTETKSQKNLTKELNAQLKIGSSDGMEAAGSDKDILEMLNVGFDTQMAAEAMEELCFGLDEAEHDNKDTNQRTKNMCEDSSRGEKENRAWSKKYFLRKRSSSSSSEVFMRNSKKTKSTGTKLSKELTVSSWKQAKNVRKQCDTELAKAEMKKAKSNAEGRFATNRIENIDNVPAEVIEQIEETTALKRNNLDEVDRCHVIASSSGRISVKKRCLQELDGISTPIARRTRQRMVTNQLRSGVAPYDSRERIHLNEASALNDRRQGGSTGGVAFTMFSKEKLSKLDSNQCGALENLKLTEQEYSHQKLTGMNAAVSIGELSYIRGRRTHRNLSGQLNGSCNLHGSATQFAGQETNEQSPGISDRPKTKAVSSSMDLGIKRKTRSSACAGSVFPSSDRQSEESLFQKRVDKGGSGDAVLKFNSVDGNVVPKDVVGALVSKRSGRQSAADTISAGEGAGGKARLEVSPGNSCKPSGVASTTPLSCTTPISAASPICMGDEYLKQSCRKNLSRSFLMKEINSLVSNGPEPTSTIKDPRRRRDMASVRVLFSRHLDENIIKQQKKILTRLGASVASSISGATHFVTDKFVRTKNMLEAIAFGKPVVTHMWLESCGQASCFIDERNYVLRDAKKEKEFGFSLPVSLAHACQRPILQGQKVLITPNTKPGKEILASLVKAVHGLAVERIGRSAFKDDKIPDDLLVLSCEEDYAICVPFLEKGAAVYSSELLLNGIVTQKLEYERHRLFADHVKKTRSTIWLKQDSNQYLRVTKRK